VTLLVNARVVTPDHVLSPGWVRVAGALIESVGAGDPPRAEDPIEDIAGRWLVPGFIDIHVHGGGGASMTDGDTGQILRATQFHRRHGTTRTLVSLVTAPLDAMLAGAAAVAELVENGTPGIAGCHLEGPFLSPVRRGAQDARSMLDPDPDLLDRLLTAGRGTVRMVTVAPELPGALKIIERVVGSGAVAAIGHTDATYAEAAAGVQAGARVATHLFNGMRPLHHRDPGPVAALLEHPDVVCELIGDGLHVAPPVIRLVAMAAGADRMALITDAISAAGMDDGDYALGPMHVRVAEGRAALLDSETLAGSTLTMDQAFRGSVRDAALPIDSAVRAASSTPARVLGLNARVGSIAPGREADLVVLDDHLELVAVMAGGTWLPDAAGRRIERPLRGGGLEEQRGT
jgi:N-acetylglucosamine-6-phosphate deacetylase